MKIKIDINRIDNSEKGEKLAKQIFEQMFVIKEN
jgi:hypothetical protein